MNVKIELNIKHGWIFYIIICFFCQFQIGYSQSSGKSVSYGLPVFHGVTGFGLDCIGGHGGKIIKVTSLNKEGKGSFAEAIEFKGPRIIVFEVAGVINLERKSLHIRNPFVTIAGQTAPYPGITIIKGGIIVHSHDIIIQHLKVRPGEAGQEKKSGWEVDGINTDGAFNVIVDHCSITWSTDENLSASGPRFEGSNPDEWRKNTSHKIVFSNCIIAEGLSNSTHSKGEHSKGSLIHDNTTEILVIGNLYANNKQRNPFFKGGAQGIIVNNYIFNPGNAAIHFSLVLKEWEGHDWLKGEMVVEANVIEYGHNSSITMPAGSFRGPVEIYWENNKIISKVNIQELSGSYTRLYKALFWPPGLECLPVDEVRNHVLENVGAFPWQRDDIDKRIIAEVKAGKGKIIDSENEVGGYPISEPVYRKFDPNEWDLITLMKKVDIRKYK